MTPFECASIVLFSVLLGIVLGVLISFRLLEPQNKSDEEIDKNE